MEQHYDAGIKFNATLMVSIFVVSKGLKVIDFLFKALEVDR